MLAWDCYNAGQPRALTPPGRIFHHAVAVSHAAGKPFGVAEWGSRAITGDDGTARAAWITASAKYLTGAGAQFALYYDAVDPQNGHDFRLPDPHAHAGWRTC